MSGPTIEEIPSKTNQKKYRAFSVEEGQYGSFVREGTGYSVEQAVAKWSRFGHFGKSPEWFAKQKQKMEEEQKQYLQSLEGEQDD